MLGALCAVASQISAKLNHNLTLINRFLLFLGLIEGNVWTITGVRMSALFFAKVVRVHNLVFR